MAFVPASLPRPTLATSFTGNSLTSKASRNDSSTLSMAAYSLDKYAKMNDSIVAPPEPVNNSPSSSWWVAYRDSLKEKFAPFRSAKDQETTVGKTKVAILASTPLGRIQAMVESSKFGMGGDPDKMGSTTDQAADKYMADCIVKQYKMTAAPYGIYNVQCTEGTVRGQAEEARNAALSASFRMNHRSDVQKYGDFCENRRKAIIASHGCSYEENLVTRFPMSGRAFVTAGSEARGNCVRYADGVPVAEVYMADCVDKQMKFRAVPLGVYDVLCSDGNAKNVAEFKRVSALAVKYRINQLPKIAVEQTKFNNKKYARDYYAHGCSYEETLFNQYPAVSASMRPSSARY